MHIAPDENVSTAAAYDGSFRAAEGILTECHAHVKMILIHASRQHHVPDTSVWLVGSPAMAVALTQIIDQAAKMTLHVALAQPLGFLSP